MKPNTRHSRSILVLALGLLVALPAIAAAAARRTADPDVCVVSYYEGIPSHTLVYKRVPPLSPGDAISLQGVYFTAANNALPFDGSAVMAADGTVRLGVYVHFSARKSTIYAYDWRFSGETDSSFAGVFHWDRDFEGNTPYTVTFEPVDCATITIP
jgi:hypothetical protein